MPRPQVLADLLTLWASHMDHAKFTPHILSQNHKQGQLIRLVLRKQVFATTLSLSTSQISELPAQPSACLRFMISVLRSKGQDFNSAAWSLQVWHLATSLALAIHLRRRSNISLCSRSGDSMRLRMAQKRPQVEEAQGNQNETREKPWHHMAKSRKQTHTLDTKLHIQCTRTHVIAKAARTPITSYY